MIARNIPYAIVSRIRRQVYYPVMCYLFDRQWRSDSLRAMQVGTKYGGGYIIPSLMNEKSLVYSFGIGEDISFDLELIKLCNCKVIGFDPTPKSIKWVEENKTIPSNFQFWNYGLDKESGKKKFYLPKNTTEVSGSLTKDLGGGYIECDFLDFEGILHKLGHQFVDFVKMDIEGAEYNVLEDWLRKKYNPPLGQMWIEFHPERAGYTNFQTAKFVRTLENISLVPVKSAPIKRTNHYLLINSKSLHKHA